MNGVSFSFVHTFGPLVQLFFVLLLLILIAALLGGKQGRSPQRPPWSRRTRKERVSINLLG